MFSWQLISFYTVGTPYEQEALEFEEHLDRFPQLNYKIIPVESKGSWVQNTNLKSSVCLEAFIQSDVPIVYTDIDSRINKYPVLFDYLSECDIGVHYRKGRELLSGTIFFNKTLMTKNLLERWVTKCNEFPSVWDQRNLNSSIEELKPYGLQVYSLPATYCQIFDLMAKEGIPVIEHFQASRRYKRVV
jgi:hypothetical protein